ncbi:acrylate utilization transcriptional regulator AcuR [Arthrobacter pigmenti]
MTSSSAMVAQEKTTPLSSSPGQAPTVPRKRGRPRKDQSQPGSPRQRLLQAGVAILTEKGFSSLGIEELLTAADVPKGSFYHYFTNKNAFGLEAIDAYAAYFAAKLDRWFTDESLDPLHRLQEFMADAADGMARHNYRRGCLVGNLGQEMGSLPDSFRNRIISTLTDWERRTARCLEACVDVGSIRSTIDVERMANIFWIGWEGAVLRTKLEGHPDALHAFEHGFLIMIGATDDAAE